ncbi:LptA/OstA family protein [Massilia sp. 9096]|uniref:LptA/OstA family protein n=1 Tax=Massilia sp. 9096 TaxID=1500894 RepID=UPI000566C36B|nr:LptA/OstA family protein [Massilia sp. 9096]
MKPFALTSFAFLLSLPLAVHAERADALKQVHADFGVVRYDKAAQKTIATGHVVITRGTMVLDAERAEVDEAADGYRTFILTAAPGGFASFRVKRDGGPDLWSDGQAERIEYDERTDVVKLFSKATLRQLEGQDVTQRMDDAFISYDQRSEVLVGRNDPVGGDRPSNGRGSMTFAPRRALPSSAMAAAPSAPGR